jgi:hypothetical protein
MPFDDDFEYCGLGLWNEVNIQWQPFLEDCEGCKRIIPSLGQHHGAADNEHRESTTHFTKCGER